jgi:hypothetical protein
MPDNQDEQPDFQAEFADLVSDVEKQLTIEGYQKERRRVLRILKRMQKGTLMGSLIAKGNAKLDAGDWRGWQTLCFSRGRKLYSELRYWVVLYLCDLNIEHLRLHGKKFPKDYAGVQNVVMAGMMEANTEFIHEQMGEDPPSPRGKMAGGN